jgi:hypothetical protein
LPDHPNFPQTHFASNTPAYFIKSVSNNKKQKSFLFRKMSEKQADAFSSNNNFSAEAQDCTKCSLEVFSNKPLVFR